MDEHEFNRILRERGEEDRKQIAQAVAKIMEERIADALSETVKFKDMCAELQKKHARLRVRIRNSTPRPARSNCACEIWKMRIDNCLFL